MGFDYNAYLASYNDHDTKADKGRFFTEDVIMESAAGKVEGRDNVLKRFATIAEHAKEELRPLNVVREGNTIMAELEACFMPLKDWDQFMTPLKKGEAVKFRFFAVYELKGDKVSYFRLAAWPKAVPIEPF